MSLLQPLSTTVANTAIRSTTFSCRTAYAANKAIWPTNHQRQQRRRFLANPFAGPQTLTATRTLQYPPSVIYDVISDVSSYSQYVPYCQGSEVTKYSQPTKDGKRYAEEAKLLIGFNNDVSEMFWSRVYCVPETTVEAVSGHTETTLAPEEIAHHNARPPAEQDPSRKDTVLSHLLTRWHLRPFPYKPPPTSATHPTTTHKNHEETSPLPGQQKTEVNLAIEYKFANPVYAALSQAAAPMVAEKMIDAFERRVKAIMEGPSH